MGKYIVSNLIRLMKNAEEFNDLKTGQEKKDYVMEELKLIIELPEHIESLIMEFIDVLIEVDKHNISFNKNIKKGCFKFIKNIC